MSDTIIKETPAAIANDGQDGDIAEFVAMVGNRVRNARANKAMSRRVLSERSNVSQRYLAQLESGEGNISIALLHKIAIALDQKVEWLVRDDTMWLPEASDILALYRDASEDQRAQALEILDPLHNKKRRANRIALIGLRGAGKSTLGPLAGQRLGIPFIELTDDIERSNGMSVHETIALYGQEGYRLLERQAIERIALSENRIVLAVAGGIVSEPETYAYLLSHYHTIWLKAEPEEHMERVRAQGDERPMAGNPAALDELRQILTSREALYAQADAVVNTSATPLEESLDAVMTSIEANGFLREATSY